LVIGGGISGITAALEIAGAGKKVYLVEKETQLGGNIVGVDLTFPYMYNAQQMLKELIANVEKHPNIEVFLNSKTETISGYIGNFEAIISNGTAKNRNWNLVISLLQPV